MNVPDRPDESWEVRAIREEAAKTRRTMVRLLIVAIVTAIIFINVMGAMSEVREYEERLDSRIESITP